jgi:hypothetical protein
MGLAQREKVHWMGSGLPEKVHWMGSLERFPGLGSDQLLA